MKKIQYIKMWAISLIIISLISIIIALCNMMGITITDVIIRILGCIEIISLPFFVFSSVKVLSIKKK